MVVLIYFLIIYVISGMSASLLYHRILAHKIYDLNPFFEKIAVFLALPAGTPIQWVGTHRKHHACTDKIGDPHSPVIDGFWFAHCGWYIRSKHKFLCLIYALSGLGRFIFDAFWRPRNVLENNSYATDLLNIPFYVWISQAKIYTSLMLIYCTSLIIISISIFGFVNGIIYLWLSLLIVYNIGDVVNSICHHPSNEKVEKNQAINRKFLALITFGEGNHRIHHDNPSKIILSETKISLSKIIVSILELTKLIKVKKYEKI